MVVSALAVLFGLIGIIRKGLGYDEIIGKHRIMVGKYQLLATDIDKELLRATTNRQEFHQFFNKILTAEDSIRYEQGSANIDHSSYEIYKRYFGDNALDYAAIFGAIPYTVNGSGTLNISVEMPATNPTPKTPQTPSANSTSLP